jgi:hypothetical protein
MGFAGASVSAPVMSRTGMKRAKGRDKRCKDSANERRIDNTLVDSGVAGSGDVLAAAGVEMVGGNGEGLALPGLQDHDDGRRSGRPRR